MYAKKYIDQNDISISERHLNHALGFCERDLDDLDRSLDSMQRQDDLLRGAAEHAQNDEVADASSKLELIVDEINFEQT